MSTKHTPGPWKVFNGMDIYPNNDDKAARHHIADCNPDDWNEALTDITIKEAEANARLIAAAPELLAACEEALRQSGCDGDLCAYAWHEKARAAIAKATGAK